MAEGRIKPAGGLSAADKETARQWMVEGHSLLRGKVQGTVPVVSPTEGDAVAAAGAAVETSVDGVHTAFFQLPNPVAYYSGVNRIKYPVQGLSPENIRNGVEILGVTGTAVMLDPAMPHGWVEICQVWDKNTMNPEVKTIAYPQLVERAGEAGGAAARIKQSGRQWRIRPVSIHQNETTVAIVLNGNWLINTSGNNYPTWDFGYLAAGSTVRIDVSGYGEAQALYSLQAYIE